MRNDHRPFEGQQIGFDQRFQEIGIGHAIHPRQPE